MESFHLVFETCIETARTLRVFWDALILPIYVQQTSVAVDDPLTVWT